MKILGLICVLITMCSLHTIYGQNTSSKDQKSNWVVLAKTTPIKLINSLRYKSSKDTLVKVITISGDAPKGWITKNDVEYLIALIDSEEKCRCLVKVISSYIPYNDYSTIGGQAMKLIDSFRQNKEYDPGLWNCIKTDNKKISEIKNWWISFNKND